MPDFRFKLGDVVMTKTGIAEAMMSCQMGYFTIPKCLTVTDRLTQECTGGVQLSYCCCSMGQRYALQEIELCPIGDFDLTAASAAINSAKPQPKE